MLSTSMFLCYDDDDIDNSTTVAALYSGVSASLSSGAAASLAAAPFSREKSGGLAALGGGGGDGSRCHTALEKSASYGGSPRPPPLFSCTVVKVLMVTLFFFRASVPLGAPLGIVAMAMATPDCREEDGGESEGLSLPMPMPDPST